ncbi:hypothetical protein BH20VER1_BH20VER1_02970 [soil metagenome]
MSVQEIEAAVSQLPPEELAAFRRWFFEFDGSSTDSASTELEATLTDRVAGPFEPLEKEWMDRVRQSAADLRET